MRTMAMMCPLLLLLLMFLATKVKRMCLASPREKEGGDRGRCDADARPVLLRRLLLLLLLLLGFLGSLMPMMVVVLVGEGDTAERRCHSGVWGGIMTVEGWWKESRQQQQRREMAAARAGCGRCQGEGRWHRCRCLSRPRRLIGIRSLMGTRTGMTSSSSKKKQTTRPL
ncbi:unnamed protein product [Ascophyllum nodosum]